MTDPTRKYQLVFGCTLPPGVRGRHRGQIEFYVERFAWTAHPLSPSPVVHLKWWGDPSDGSWLPFEQPRRNVFLATSALVFPVLTSRKGFRNYLHDMGVLGIHIEDARSEAVLASTFIPIHNLLDVPVDASFALHADNGSTVARIDIKVCIVFALEEGSVPYPNLGGNGDNTVSPKKKHFRRRISDASGERIDGASLELPSMQSPKKAPSRRRANITEEKRRLAAEGGTSGQDESDQEPVPLASHPASVKPAQIPSAKADKGRSAPPTHVRSNDEASVQNVVVSSTAPPAPPTMPISSTSSVQSSTPRPSVSNGRQPSPRIPQSPTLAPSPSSLTAMGSIPEAQPVLLTPQRPSPRVAVDALSEENGANDRRHPPPASVSSVAIIQPSSSRPPSARPSGRANDRLSPSPDVGSSYKKRLYVDQGDGSGSDSDDVEDAEWDEDAVIELFQRGQQLRSEMNHAVESIEAVDLSRYIREGMYHKEPSSRPVEESNMSSSDSVSSDDSDAPSDDEPIRRHPRKPGEGKAGSANPAASSKGVTAATGQKPGTSAKKSTDSATASASASARSAKVQGRPNTLLSRQKVSSPGKQRLPDPNPRKPLASATPVVATAAAVVSSAQPALPATSLPFTASQTGSSAVSSEPGRDDRAALLPGDVHVRHVCVHFMSVRNLDMSKLDPSIKPRMLIRIFRSSEAVDAIRYSKHRAVFNWLKIIPLSRFTPSWWEGSIVLEVWHGDTLLGLSTFPWQFLFGYLVAKSSSSPLVLVEQLPLRNPLSSAIVGSTDLVFACGFASQIRQVSQQIEAAIVLQRSLRMISFKRHFNNKNAHLVDGLLSPIRAVSNVPSEAADVALPSLATMRVFVLKCDFSGLRNTPHETVNLDTLLLRYSLPDGVLVTLPALQAAQVSHKFVDPEELFRSAPDTFEFVLVGTHLRYTSPGEEESIVVGRASLPKVLIVDLIRRSHDHARSQIVRLDFAEHVFVTLKLDVSIALHSDVDGAVPKDLRSSISGFHLPPYDLIRETLPSETVFNVEILRACGLKAAAKHAASRNRALELIADIGVNAYVRFSVLRKSVHAGCAHVTNDGLDFHSTAVKARNFTPSWEHVQRVTIALSREMYALLAFGDAVFQVWHAVPSHRSAEGAVTVGNASDALLGTVSFPSRRMMTSSQGLHGWFTIMNESGQTVGSLQLKLSVDHRTFSSIESLSETSSDSSENLTESDSESDGSLMRSRRRTAATGAMLRGDADHPVLQCSVLIDHVKLPSSEDVFVNSRATYFVSFSFYGELHATKSFAREADADGKHVRLRFTQEYIRVSNTELQDFFRNHGVTVLLYRVETSGKESCIGECAVDCAALVSVDQQRKPLRFVGGIIPLVTHELVDASDAGHMAVKVIVQQIASDSPSDSDVDEATRVRVKRPERPNHPRQEHGDDEEISVPSIHSSDSPRQPEPERPSPMNILKVTVEKALHLPFVSRLGDVVPPSTFVQFPAVIRNGVSRVVPDSCSPYYGHSVDVPIFSVDELDEPIFFEIREVVDADKRLSRVAGSVSIDVSVLRTGLSEVHGFYHIVNIRGDACGQVSVEVCPVRPFRKRNATATGALSNSDYDSASSESSYDKYQHLDLSGSVDRRRTYQDLLQDSLRFSHLFDRDREHNQGLLYHNSTAVSSSFSQYNQPTHVEESPLDLLDRRERDLELALLARQVEELDHVQDRLRRFQDTLDQPTDEY